LDVIGVLASFLGFLRSANHKIRRLCESVYKPSFPALFSRNKLPSLMYRRTI
jgi:hypothetical protein